MRFPFEYMSKPSPSLVDQKRAAWTDKEPTAAENDRFEQWLIGGLMLCTVAFLLLFLLMLGQLP